MELGETMATQWYCPPAVGYAERNSAREEARQMLQIPAVISPHITDVGPPLGSATDIDTASAVHEFRMAKAKPSIEIKEKLRCSSGLWPISSRK